LLQATTKSQGDVSDGDENREVQQWAMKHPCCCSKDDPRSTDWCMGQHRGRTTLLTGRNAYGKVAKRCNKLIALCPAAPPANMDKKGLCDS